MTESTMFRKKLQDKVVIITGGASGIGEATARLFAVHGARIVIADIQDKLGQQVAASIGNSICDYKHADVTDEDQVKSLVEWTVEKYGHIDIMFSNAGIICTTSDQTVLDLDLHAMDQVSAVNVRGTAACVKHAARAMVEGRVRGSIVCTASVAASCGSVAKTDYYMSKHAVLGLVRCASKQLGGYGIRVNCVSPYGVATPGLCRMMNMEVEKVEMVYEANTRLKGGVLKVKHVADAVLFLASEDSEFVNGHDLVVDGGFLCK